MPENKISNLNEILSTNEFIPSIDDWMCTEARSLSNDPGASRSMSPIWSSPNLINPWIVNFNS